MKITTILPVSRMQFLDKVLDSLKNQTYKPNNLLVVFDGNDNDFIEVRNKVVELDYEAILCVPSTNQRQAFTIAERRQHIVNIHNQIREILIDCDWIFSIEDDGILPPDALEKLVNSLTEDTGMVTGVELGRWGVPYVGAWIIDDIHEPKQSTSMLNKTLTDPDLIEEIDGCGLYCALIRADMYKKHEFYTMNGLGPDVNLGLFLRREGLKNYINWGIPVTHLTSNGFIEIEIPATGESRTVSLKLLSGSTWQASSA